MKYALLVVASLCLLFESCYCECCACEGAAGEIYLTVLDMDNKPIKNVTVGPYLPYSFIKGRFQTDEKGQVKMNYVFPIDASVSWSLAATDENDYKAVDYIESPYSYTPEHKKITSIDTIRMDVLKPITLRFKSNKTGIKSLYLRVYEGSYPNYKKIKRDFYLQTIPLSATMPLDTTIQVSAYSKAEITILTGLEFGLSTPTQYQNRKLSDYEQRDAVFLFEF